MTLVVSSQCRLTVICLKNRGGVIDLPTIIMPFISKSKFLWGLQCQKLLWHAYNAKNLIPKPDDSQQAIFDQGHEVGALAKLLFPGGIEVGQGIVDIETVLQLSEKTIKQRRPLFEAAFRSEERRVGKEWRYMWSAY